MRILKSKSAWLDDLLIMAGQNILKMQFPHISGLQLPALTAVLAVEPPKGDFVQVMHVGRNHWITVSNVHCEPGQVMVFDSLKMSLGNHSLKVIADFMQSDRSHIELLYVDIKGQSGTNDCGLYALAFATSVCYGNKPKTVFYHQHEMRAHLLHCIENKCLTEYPNEARENYQLPKIQSLPIYCICRFPDDGSQMISCSNCEDWYHVKCVGVEDTCGYWLCCNCQSKYSLCPHVYVLNLLTLFLENMNASSTYVSFEELKMSIAKNEV